MVTQGHYDIAPDDVDIAVRAERDRLLARIEELADEFVLNVDWSAGRSNYGDNDAWEAAAQNLRALLAEEREESW